MASRNLTTDDLGVIVHSIVNNICKSIGVDKLSDIRLLAESVSNGVPELVQTSFEKLVLCKPEMAKDIVEAIVKDEGLCSQLGYALDQTRKKKFGEAAERRRDNLTAAVSNFYSRRDPEASVSIEIFAPLVERIDAAGVVRGLRPTQYDEAVSRNIEEREMQMEELIASLCKSRTNKEIIASFGRLIVLEGIPFDKEVVRARLEKEDDIVPFLKKMA